jgi:hypothetical protein
MVALAQTAFKSEPATLSHMYAFFVIYGTFELHTADLNILKGEAKHCAGGFGGITFAKLVLDYEIIILKACYATIGIRKIHIPQELVVGLLPETQDKQVALLPFIELPMDATLSCGGNG